MFCLGLRQAESASNSMCVPWLMERSILFRLHPLLLLRISGKKLPSNVICTVIDQLGDGGGSFVAVDVAVSSFSDGLDGVLSLILNLCL